MLSKLFPMVQFKKDTWEIDEFDIASMFLLVGTEKALLIDLGMGVGDLRGAVEGITDKPITVVCSHGHIDHTGHGREFDEIYLNPKDGGKPIPQNYARRRYDVEHIAQRNKGSIGSPFNMYKLYGYDIEIDLSEPSSDSNEPIVHDLVDGMQFDLGGGRVVTAYEVPGHTAGQMFFLDEMTKTVIVGDALNFNLGVAAVPIEVTHRALKRLESMKDKYDGIWNGHHDFRGFGEPLAEDCLPTVISICEDIMKGNYSPCQVPSFWGQNIPLTNQPIKNDAPPMDPNSKVKPVQRTLVRKGRNYLYFDENKIFEEH